MRRLDKLPLAPSMHIACETLQKYVPMSGRRYEGPSNCLIGLSAAWAHVIFDDVVTVSFKFSGHVLREEATQVWKEGIKESTIRARIQVIVQRQS